MSGAGQPELLDLAARIAEMAGPGEQIEAFVARSTSTSVRAYQGEVESLANIHTRAWKPLQIATGITSKRREGALVAKYRFHDLRHFHASHLIADGTNPKEVMVEMGHATISVTMDTYGSLFRDDDAEQERRE